MNIKSEKLKEINRQIKLISDIRTLEVSSDNKDFDYYNGITISYLKGFFNQKRNKDIDDYEQAIRYNRDIKLKNIEGYIKITGIANGVSAICIGLSKNNNPLLIPAITHEKIHAYQILNKNEVSEAIPNFFEILISRELDKDYGNLFLNDLAFKIEGAKKQSAHSIKKSLFKDYGAIEDAKKTEAFCLCINLLLKYIEDKNYVKALMEENLFSNTSVEEVKKYIPTYLDYDMDEKIKIIKRSL